MEIHPGIGAGGGSTTFEGEIRREAKKTLPDGAKIVGVHVHQGEDGVNKCEHGYRLYDVEYEVGEAPFQKLSTHRWALTREGYTATVDLRAEGYWVTVTNSGGDVVDEGVEGGTGVNVFREARWKLDSAIEAGE